MKVTSVITLSIVIVLAGCATNRYDGPGSPQDFAAATSQCVLEASARTNGAYAHPYGGVTMSYPLPPTCSAITTCLAAKGYQPRPNGRFDVASTNANCSN